YLAAGRPVITQDTGFSNFLPTGAGLFGFSTMEEILKAVEEINADYGRNCQAAADLARDYFNYDVVLTKFLADLGLETYNRIAAVSSAAGDPLPKAPCFAESLILSLTSRWPTQLPQETSDIVLAGPLPAGSTKRMGKGGYRGSIIVVTFNELVYTRLCLE